MEDGGNHISEEFPQTIEEVDALFHQRLENFKPDTPYAIIHSTYLELGRMYMFIYSTNADPDIRLLATKKADLMTAYNGLIWATWGYAEMPDADPNYPKDPEEIKAKHHADRMESVKLIGEINALERKMRGKAESTAQAEPERIVDAEGLVRWVDSAKPERESGNGSTETAAQSVESVR